MNSELRILPKLFVFALLTTGWLALSLQGASAQGDELVTLCFRNHTIQVPPYLVARYITAGATAGPCSPVPFFSTQPQSQTRYVGGSVTFTSVAGGEPAPTYQWRFNGNDLSGATNAEYSIANIQTNHAGNYSVKASNASGSATSTPPAVLTVLTSLASLMVTNNNNAGPGSLRQAIYNAESVANPVVTFAANVTGIITLTNGEIPITKSLTIAGPGANVLGVSGNHASRVFYILSGAVSISGLTIRDGAELESIGFPEQNGAQARGGGIFNQAALTLLGCVISNNAVVAGRGGDSLENGGFSYAGNGGNGSGGGICNIATLTMIDCSIVSNSATGGEGGNDTGGNNGTGGQGYGGGLYTFGTATLTRCTVSGNHATAGIGNGGVGGGSGGGIDNELSLALTNCTVANNTAEGSQFDFGGGVFDNGTELTIRNSTISGNQADYGGGLSASAANLGNTILAGNSASGSGPDCSGGITSSDYNLIQNTADSTITGTITHNLAGQDPLLGPLQDNGGMTWTMSPQTNSPVLDMGKNFGTATDQRGQLRPYELAFVANAAGGDGSDIGALELHPPKLNIARSADNVLLFWSSSWPGFRLQSATNLTASNDWTSLSNAPAIIGSKFYVTNSAASEHLVYRLIFP